MRYGEQFPLGVILSVTTFVLCCKFRNVKHLLAFMTQDENTSTVSAPRQARECTPYLYEQLPFLRDITAADVLPDKRLKNHDKREASCFAKVAKLAVKYGAYHTVYPIHPEDHEQLSPEEDARRLGFKGRVINFDPSHDNSDEISPSCTINFKGDA